MSRVEDAFAPAIARPRIGVSPYASESGRWRSAAFLFMSAVLIQVVLQAQSLGQTIRTRVLGWEPAAMLGGRALLVMFNVALLGMLVAAIRNYDAERRESFRRAYPISFWTFTAGLGLLAIQVVTQGLGVAFADPAVTEHLGAFGLSIDPVLLRFDMNLMILIASVVGFLGMGVADDLLLRGDAKLALESRASLENANALRMLALSERVYGQADKAEVMIEEAASIAESVGDFHLAGTALADLAEFQRDRGMLGAALETYRRCTTIAFRAQTDGVELAVSDADENATDRWRRAMGGFVPPSPLASVFTRLANKEAADGNLNLAATMMGVARAIRETDDRNLDASAVDAERAIAAGLDVKDEEGFWSAWARGRTLTPSESFAFALRSANHITL